MLRYNFNKVFRTRAVDRPFTFLRQAGFSDNFASNVKNNRIKRLNLDLLERLCLHLDCTPNDLMEWEQDRGHNVDKNHALHELKKTDKVLELTKTLNLMPLSKLAEIEKLIHEHK